MHQSPFNQPNPDSVSSSEGDAMAALNQAKNIAADETFESAGINSAANTDLQRPIMGEGKISVAGKEEPYRFELSRISDGVLKLTVDAASELARVGVAFAVAAKDWLRKPAIALAGAAIGIGAAGAENSEAALRPDGSNRADYINYADQFSGQLLWVSATYNGSTVYGSAVRINSEYAITAAHIAYSPAGTAGFTLAVGDGSNLKQIPELLIQFLV